MDAPAGARTPDTRLKRAVLYLLSYWGQCAVLPLAPIEAQRSGFDWERKKEPEDAPLSPPGGSGADQASSGVAGMAGLEPTISESKSGVLPLHYIPKCKRAVLWKKRPAQPASAFSGVGYGARTHDTRNHNPVLYQLS